MNTNKTETAKSRAASYAADFNATDGYSADAVSSVGGTWIVIVKESGKVIRYILCVPGEI